MDLSTVRVPGTESWKLARASLPSMLKRRVAIRPVSPEGADGEDGGAAAGGEATGGTPQDEPVGMGVAEVRVRVAAREKRRVVVFILRVGVGGLGSSWC